MHYCRNCGKAVRKPDQLIAELKMLGYQWTHVSSGNVRCDGMYYDHSQAWHKNKKAAVSGWGPFYASI